MSQQKLEVLDGLAESMDLLYQAWRILYDGGRKSDEEIIEAVEQCLIILGKMRKQLVK